MSELYIESSIYEAVTLRRTLELELRPRYNYQTVSNSMQKGANRNVHSYGGSFYATYTTPIGGLCFNRYYETPS